MKEIQPYEVASFGSIKIAHFLLAYINEDNLLDEAIVYIGLYDELKNKIADTTMNVTGQDYVNYTSNEYIYQLIEQTYNIVIISPI